MKLEEGLIAIVVGVIGAWLARQTNADGSKDVDPNAEAIKRAAESLRIIGDQFPASSAAREAVLEQIRTMGAHVSMASEAFAKDAERVKANYEALLASTYTSRSPDAADPDNRGPITPAQLLASPLKNIHATRDSVKKAIDLSNVQMGPTILPVALLLNDNKTTDAKIAMIRALRVTKTFYYGRVWLYYTKPVSSTTKKIWVHIFEPADESWGWQSTIEMIPDMTSGFVWSGILTNDASKPRNYQLSLDGNVKLLFTNEEINVEDDTLRLNVLANDYGVQVPVYNSTRQNMMIYEVTTVLPDGAHPKGEGWDYINV